MIVEEHPACYEATDREHERMLLQVAIDGAKSPLNRNRMGQYSTPFELAKQIVSQSLPFLPDKRTIRFLEPAAGTGVFFSAMASTGARHILTDSVGIEIDAAYARAALDLWKPLGVIIREASFLDYARDPKNHGSIDYICANPPYVRHHHISSGAKIEMQEYIRANLSIQTSGLSGLYVYFILLAHEVLAEEAVASWLIPSEFFVTNYGAALRHYLLRNVELISIHQFNPEDVQFDDALVSSCVVTYRKRTPPARHIFAYSYGGSLISPSEHKKINTNEINCNTSWRFRSTSGIAADSTLCQSATIGDLFDIKRGIATGANNFFLITPQQASILQIPPQFLIPVLPSARYINDPVIQSNAEGMPINIDYKFLVNCGHPPEIVKSLYPSLWRYLKKGEEAGVNNGYLCSIRTPWYAQEQRHPAPYLASYMGRTTSSKHSPITFFKNESRAIVTNTMLNLYPKPWLKKQINTDPSKGNALFELLGSIRVETIFNGGRSYGGGLHKVEPSELARIPLNSPPKWAAIPTETQLVLL